LFGGILPFVTLIGLFLKQESITSKIISEVSNAKLRENCRLISLRQRGGISCDLKKDLLVKRLN